MSDSRYTYNPKTGEYTFTPASLSRLVYRCSNPKDKIEAEDARENEERIKRSRKARGL